MSFFSLDNNQDFIFNNGNSIECIKCSEQQKKYIRCNCCNEVITLSDIVKHINKADEIIKLVRLSGALCIKVKVKDIYNISKYFYTPDVHTLAVNFNYKINYIENKLPDGQVMKGIRNIELIDMLTNFKESSIDVKYLLMSNSTLENAEVLLNVNNFNVLLPSSS